MCSKIRKNGLAKKCTQVRLYHETRLHFCLEDMAKKKKNSAKRFKQLGGQTNIYLLIKSVVYKYVILQPILCKLKCNVLFECKYILLVCLPSERTLFS